MRMPFRKSTDPADLSPAGSSSVANDCELSAGRQTAVVMKASREFVTNGVRVRGVAYREGASG